MCEFGWYNWVHFRDNAVTYPNDKWVLERWIGPSIDIGAALCAKILKENGRCVYRSSYRHLTEDEVNSPEEIKKRESYDQMIYSKLGSSASTHDFEEDYLTPEYELYEDDVGDGISHAKECNDDPTAITYVTYIGAEVVLPKGNDMASGTVMSRVKDLRDSPLVKLTKIQSWTQGFTMLNYQMVRMQNWEQISLQNACMLSVTLKVTNTGSWIIVLIIERITMKFAKITMMLQ